MQWGGQHLLLYISGLQILAISGYDRDRLTAAFGLTEGEWFADAKAAIEAGQVTLAEATAVIKGTLVENLMEFFLAPDAEISFDSEIPFEDRGLTVSYPHLIVEMVLGPGGEALVERLLPSPEAVLRRLPDFPRRVGALALTEEGMAVLAKIDDRRSASEIAERSPHGSDTALRLLAAAAGAGLAEASAPVSEVTLAATSSPELIVESQSRRWLWVVVLVVVVAAVLALVIRPWEGTGSGPATGPWSVAVDGGCQPAEVERLYRRKEQDPVRLKVVPFGRGDDQCYRLVWGGFASRDLAERAMVSLPSGVLARGFAPHVVKVEATTP